MNTGGGGKGPGFESRWRQWGAVMEFVNICQIMRTFVVSVCIN